MAWEFRRPIFDLQGALTVGIGASDTLIRSSRFTTLPTDYSSGSYLPLTIADDSGSEVVWVTGHANASDGVTVSRGREGTTARAFDSTAVVRCTPTLRDGLWVASTRSALPADAHYGLRALILNEAQVVEKTSAGWNDSAPLEDDVTRKHRWSQAGATLAAGSAALLTGLSGSQNGTTGSIGTMSGGVFTPNLAGDWSFALALYIGNLGVRNQGVEMNWPGSASFVTGDNLYNYHGVNSGSNGLTLLEWGPTYVSSSNATKGISVRAFSSIAATNCQFDFYAEYRGR